MENIKSFIKKHPLVFIMIILCCISCFAVLCAAPLIQKHDNPEMLWFKQFVFYIIGVVIIYIINKVGNDQVYDKIWIIYGILMVLLALLVLDHYISPYLPVRHIIPFANKVGGATAWYQLPGFSFQPSEFMKIVIVIALARITKESNDYVLVRTFESELSYIMKCMAVVLPPALLVYLQNDAGVVLIILVGVVFVLFSSGLRGQWFTVGLIIVGLIIAIGAYLFIFQPNIFAKIVTGHKLDRFYGWVDPEGTIKNQGYQLFYSLLSYGTAGWFGHGFQSVIMNFPEAQTDFIFAVIATNYGFVGGMITLGALVALDIIILKIGFETTNHQDKFFVMGIFGMLVFQQVWNIGMILGLLPITGITLPFISYGGSSLLSYMIAIGMFLDIESQNQLVKNKQVY
ncbi:MAG: FtsW/RodA/SpoVE family cell cycle protein [Erysipelotrichales bacterium]|nr:FtsW/RodA/SpoVE family cell cycle protein [Erysipelotrichales bacterium]